MKYRTITYLCTGLLLLSGCSAMNTSAEPNNTNSGVTTETTAGQNTPNSGSALVTASYTEEDINAAYDQAAAVSIALADDAIEITGAGATSTEQIVTITKAGTYVISGTLSNGQIIIDADKQDTVRLILNNASITCSDSAAIYAKKAKKTILTMADNSANFLTDGASYQYADDTVDEPDAALFCKDDLTINGSGSLTVNGNFNNGIGTKDNLIITGGTITVTAKNDALRGRDSVSISNGAFVLTADGDGIKANNDEDTEKGWIAIDGGAFTITAANDGIQAETALQINDGSFEIITGGGSENGESHVESFGGGFGRGGGNRDVMPGQPPSDMSQNTGEQPQNRQPRDISGSDTPPSMPQASEGQPQNRQPRDASSSDAPPAMPDDASGAAVQPTQIDIVASSDTNTITSDSYKGIKSGSGLLLAGGSFTIDSADDAIHTNGDATITGGNFTISTGDDGVHADGALFIGSNTERSYPVITILESYEGLEGATISITNGNIVLAASDDGINAAGGSDSQLTGGRFQADSFASTGNNGCFIRITDGFLSIDAEGDGIDSNGNLYIDGGTVIVNGPTRNGNSALDYDGACEVTGGILLASGSAGMVQSASSSSEQNVLKITFPSVQSAGTLLYIEKDDGTPIVSFAPAKDYQSIIISSPSLVQGTAYTVYSGGSDSGVETAGLYDNSNHTGGTKLFDITFSQPVMNVSSDGSASAEGHGDMPGNKMQIERNLSGAPGEMPQPNDQ